MQYKYDTGRWSLYSLIPVCVFYACAFKCKYKHNVMDEYNIMLAKVYYCVGT